MEMVRCMLFDRKINKNFWGEAINTTIYTLNRISSQTLHDLTPFEKWFGYSPDVKHLHIFESIAYAHVPKELRKKLDSKTRECLFLGYSETSKAYRLWCPEKHGVILSRDVIFDEDSTDVSSILSDSPIFSATDDLFPHDPVAHISDEEPSSSSLDLPSASTSLSSTPFTTADPVYNNLDPKRVRKGKQPMTHEPVEVSSLPD
jgi:hypothetical protein